MLKTTTTLNELKIGDKMPQFLSKVRVSLEIKGIHNLPTELRGKNMFEIPYKFSVYFLGEVLKGGEFVEKLLTEEEKGRMEPVKQKGKKTEEIDYERMEPKLNRESKKLEEFYSVFEDPYKFASIKFPPDNEKKNRFFEFTKKNLVLLEESIFERKGEFVYLICEPEMDELEVKKILLKKKDADIIDMFKPQLFY